MLSTETHMASTTATEPLSTDSNYLAISLTSLGLAVLTQSFLFVNRSFFFKTIIWFTFLIFFVPTSDWKQANHCIVKLLSWVQGVGVVYVWIFGPNRLICCQSSSILVGWLIVLLGHVCIVVIWGHGVSDHDVLCSASHDYLALQMIGLAHAKTGASCLRLRSTDNKIAVAPDACQSTTCILILTRKAKVLITLGFSQHTIMTGPA